MKDFIVPVSKIDPYCAMVVLQFAQTPVLWRIFKCLQCPFDTSVAFDKLKCDEVSWLGAAVTKNVTSLSDCAF